MEISRSSVIVPRHLKVRLWEHERTPGISRNVEDLETVEFADVLGAIAEDLPHDTMRSSMFHRYRRRPS